MGNPRGRRVSRNGSAQWRRLHPLTPLLRSARFIGLAVVAISWQGYQQLGTQRWVIAIVCVMVIAFACPLISIGIHSSSFPGMFDRSTT